jgi:DNA invertase Pin-like site-specific DNA recombinase
MTATRVGYARCSTAKQDLTVQQAIRQDLGVTPERSYMDRGLTGTTRARLGLDQALAAVRAGDTLVVPKLDRLARSVPDARQIADALVARGVKLALGTSVYDPADPMGKMFFNILATFAEFEADFIRLRTREGMAIARAKGKLRGKRPKLSDKQQTALRRMHHTGEYSISDLAELFSVSRPTVSRTLARKAQRSSASDAPQSGEDLTPGSVENHNECLVTQLFKNLIERPLRNPLYNRKGTDRKLPICRCARLLSTLPTGRG